MQHLTQVDSPIYKWCAHPQTLLKLFSQYTNFSKSLVRSILRKIFEPARKSLNILVTTVKSPPAQSATLMNSSRLLKLNLMSKQLNRCPFVNYLFWQINNGFFFYASVLNSWKTPIFKLSTFSLELAFC